MLLKLSTKYLLTRMLSMDPAASPIVCHVTTVHPVPDPRIFLKQCRSLAAAGFDVHVIITGDGEGFDWQNVHPISVGERTTNRLRRVLLFPKIACELRRLRPQVIHFHDPELLPLMCLLQATALTCSKFIYDVHEDYATLVKTYGFPWNLTVWLYDRLARFAERHMTFVLAEESYQERFQRIHPVIHNFSTAVPGPVESERDNTFIYVGSVCETRGALTMTECFRRLQQPSWRLQVIGPASEELAAHLRSVAASASVFPSQIEVCDYLPLSVALGKIRRAKVGLCLLSPEPNYVGSLPTKVFDYLSVGVPVILSDFPYYRRFFDGVPGIHFVDATNLAEVESKMREFCNPALAQRYIEEAIVGRDICQRRFTWRAEADRLTKIYRELINHSLMADNIVK